MNTETISLFSFDHDFYISTYKDLNLDEYNTKEKSLAHYLRWGKKEGRCCCEKEMIQKHQKHLENAVLKNNSFPVLKDKLFNILIRTSNRSEYFKSCIKSILNQTYSHFKIFVCYDTSNSEDYIKEYECEKLVYFPVQNSSNEKYKFNLYCNSLLQCVENGYILFLDDDNYFLTNRALEMLNWCSGDHKIITWTFLRPDMLIKKNNSTPLSLGEVDTSNVCFCSSIKNKSKWIDKQFGDYNYFKPLFDKYGSFYFDYTLTGTQFNNKIGNFGKN